MLGRKIASHEGYEYSDALKSKSSEDWDYEKINHMIENPNAFAPGTKMALFPGLPDAKQRADVIVFLRTKNDNPPPLPEPVAAGGGEGKPAGETAGGGAAAGGSEVVALLATADPKQGEADAGLCKVCHKFEKGGGALVGPDLYGVVGRKIASVEGFNYTPALKAHDGVWTYENLDPWLKNPQAFAPGTMMAFPGVADAKKRANIIAFLRMNADTPAPLPEGCRGDPAGRSRGEAGRGRTARTTGRDAGTAGGDDTAGRLKPRRQLRPRHRLLTKPHRLPRRRASGRDTCAGRNDAAEPPKPLRLPRRQRLRPRRSQRPATPPFPRRSRRSSRRRRTIPPSESSAGEPPSANQPQPVYPEGKPEGVE